VVELALRVVQLGEGGEVFRGLFVGDVGVAGEFGELHAGGGGEFVELGLVRLELEFCVVVGGLGDAAVVQNRGVFG
jgi:hypothetical protein